LAELVEACFSFATNEEGQPFDSSGKPVEVDTEFPPMRILIAALALAATAACTTTRRPDAQSPTQRTVAPILTTADARDPHSYARPEVARVTHVALDLGLDFEARRVAGTATLDILAVPGAREIVLDTKNLEILGVTDTSGRALPLVLGATDKDKGEPLTIQMGDARRIVIRYRTREGAEALQWLTPDQTAGKRHPFLLSQGQPTLNRTWIPTQDSPGIRQTWEARITAPSSLKVVMSGDRLTPDGEPAGAGRRAYRFRMANPVAPYLIAIAAGDISFRELGRRTGVWAEPETLQRAAAELTDTERMVEAAEALYGPYRWGRFDVIVLPPSFPYGGMENPTLTFLTPTFIAGDKSLVGLVAHELAHSWSGNLVTNATWADSWLNEGFTNYFENRIMEAIYGAAAPPGGCALVRRHDGGAEQGGDERPHHPRSTCAGRGLTRRRRHRHHLRQGRRSSCAPSRRSSAATLRRMAALLFRSPRLSADDLRRGCSRPARQPAARRPGAELRLMLDHGCYQPGLPPTSLAPIPLPSRKSTRP
jgi:hypothetical protein